jgi:heme oxygenase (biliverdin-IX-beta and delta-forming)
MANEKDKAIVAEVRALMRGAGFARLATFDAGTGTPFVSLLAVALSDETRPLTLISSLARHTANLDADARASLLYEEPLPGDERLLSRPRVTISGTVAKRDDPDARDLFLAAHEDAQLYADFSDFALWQMEIKEAYLVAGFGKIHTIPGSDLMT